MGRRDSTQRVAHLICELYVRARNVGLTENQTFAFLLTQAVLGDALGLTPLHVTVFCGSTIEGRHEPHQGKLVIADITELNRIAGFEDYLHRRVLRKS